MRHFTAAEAQGDFHLIARIEELGRRFHLDLKIMRTNTRTQLDLLNLDDLLLLAGFLEFFLLSETELPVIEQFTHRRLSLRRDFYEVEPGSFRRPQPFGHRGDADHFRIGPNKADLVRNDFAIHPRFFTAFFLKRHG